MNKILQPTLLAAGALLLSACVVAPPPPQPLPDPHIAALRRAEQVQQRIEHEAHSIDTHVAQGYYPPPQGYQLHQQLASIQQQKQDMAAQHGGGLSGAEQHALNQELDGAAHMIGQ